LALESKRGELKMISGKTHEKAEEKQGQGGRTLHDCVVALGRMGCAQESRAALIYVDVAASGTERGGETIRARLSGAPDVKAPVLERAVAAAEAVAGCGDGEAYSPMFPVRAAFRTWEKDADLRNYFALVGSSAGVLMFTDERFVSFARELASGGNGALSGYLSTAVAALKQKQPRARMAALEALTSEDVYSNAARLKALSREESAVHFSRIADESDTTRFKVPPRFG
jgi:hypothetical protein